MNAPAYRPEVDGLRAVAVLPVILFHAGFSGFSGGYVGVDVFFVISGYLITSILLKELVEDRYSIARFYERRARRILPALLLVITATTPFAWAWLSAPQYADYAASIIAVLLFVSNFLFWQQADYFDTAAEEKPLLHTWSLAIEEQYYIIFPIMLWLLWRKLGPRAALTAIAVMLLASLAFSEMIARDRTVANFYLLPSRAWELLVGSLCAFAHHQRPRQPNGGLTALGLGMIALSIVLFDEATPFPSLSALLPVGGSALVLLFGDTKSMAGKLLSWAPMVGIGLISYSAYLWHQPLFALARVRFDVPDAGLVLSLLAIASLVLAWLSWKYVEQPFRKGMPLKSFVVRTGVVAALLAVVGAVGIVEASKGYSRFERIVYNEALINSDVERRASWTAVLENPDYAERLATYGEGAEHRVLLVGDSHAKDVFNALWFGAGAGEPDGPFQVRHINLGGRCTDRMTNWMDRTTPQQCFRQFERQAGVLLDQADVVILTKRWVLEETWQEYLPEYVRRLQAMGKTVAIAGNTVEYDPEVPELLRRLYRLDRLDAASAAELLGSMRREDVALTNAGLRRMAQQLGIAYLDKEPFLCSGAGCAGLTAEGAAIYSDYGHWTLAGAREIGGKMRDAGWLAPVLDGGAGE